MKSTSEIVILRDIDEKKDCEWEALPGPGR